MENIEIKILNPGVISEAEKMMVCAARLTQRGHNVKNMNDFTALYEKSYKPETAETMAKLPHTTLQKFGVINVVVVGASRRFLTQITRHQNEVKFMATSLQYSDYSDNADFVVPYNLLGEAAEVEYLSQCKESAEKYKQLIVRGTNNDTAGYLLPQSLRSIIIISATPYQFKHMITSRICRRNTFETRYIMLKIWEALYNISPIMFRCGAACMTGCCNEGKMACGAPIDKDMTPSDIIKIDFPRLMKGTEYDENSNN